MGPSRSCWNGITSALQPEEITSKGTKVSCVYYQQKCPYEKSLETYCMLLVCADRLVGLVSLLNGISTFMGYLISKSALSKNNGGTI